MASEFVLWDRKARAVLGVFASSADATSASRRVIAKAGSAAGMPVLDVLTTTKP